MNILKYIRYRLLKSLGLLQEPAVGVPRVCIYGPVQPRTITGNCGNGPRTLSGSCGNGPRTLAGSCGNGPRTLTGPVYPRTF